MNGAQPLMSSSRLRVVWMANRPMSTATQRRFSFSATAGVVPLPAKQSSTIEPSSDDDLMIRSRSASGFCVSYPSRSLACGLIGKTSSQTSPRGIPRDLTKVAIM